MTGSMKLFTMMLIFLLMMSSMLLVQSEDASYGSAIVGIGEQSEANSQKLSILLIKQDQLLDQLKKEKVSGTKRNEAAGKVGKIFAAIRYAQIGYDGAAMLTSVEILGDLLSLTTFLPGLGPLVSQVASGFIHLFFNPTQGSIIKNALETQYFLELENDGIGNYGVIDHIRVDLEHLENVVYSETLKWDQGADDTLTSIHTGTRYTEIIAFMGKLQNVIIDKLESTRKSHTLEMRPVLKHINLYFILTEYLEVQYIRLAILLEMGLKKEPTLKRYKTVISKMRKHWIPALHYDAKKLLKYFWEPELKNVQLVVELHWNYGEKLKTDILRYLTKKEEQSLLKHKETPLENGDNIEIWKDSIRLNANCPPSLPITSCYADFSGARNDVVWILEEDNNNYKGYKIASATTRYTYNRLTCSVEHSMDVWRENSNIHFWRHKLTYFVIRVKDTECGHDVKNDKRQCYAIVPNPTFLTHRHPYKGGLDRPTAFIIKKASTKLTQKRSDAARQVQLTSKGDRCITPCEYHGNSYKWCETGKGSSIVWDYCSTSEGFTSRNKQCKDLGKSKYSCPLYDPGTAGGRDYRYCDTTGGSWDYCSIVDIDKHDKAYSRQPDKFSYIGRCYGRGVSTKDKVKVEDQPTELRCYKQCLKDARATGCEFSKTGKCVKWLDQSLTSEGDGNKDYRCFVFNTRVGYCVDSNERDVNGGVTILSQSMTDQNCYEQCRNMENVTACEWNTSGTCAVHTKKVAKGSGNQSYKCWVF